MPIGDISTTKQFVNGQLGVDGSDLNAIVGQSSIQTAFYSAQSAGSSPGDNDYLMLLSSGGSFYKLLYQNFFNTNRVRLATGIPQWVTTINGDMSVWQWGTSFTTPVTGSYIADRYRVDFSLATGSVSLSQVALSGSLQSGDYQPAFAIRATVATQNTGPAAGDFYTISQRIERRQARKLFGGVSSAQIWVRTSVAGTYAFFIRDSSGAVYYKQDFNVGTPNTWQQLSLPNIPVFPLGSGNWGTNETDYSYQIGVTLVAGSNFQSANQSTWTTSGGAIASASQTNLLNTVSATFDLCLLQHESGPVVTTFLPDDDYSETFIKCSRYALGLSAMPMGLADTATLLFNGVIRNNWRVTPTIAASPAASFTVNAGSAGTPAIVSGTSGANANASAVVIENSAANWTASADVALTCVLTAEL